MQVKGRSPLGIDPISEGVTSIGEYVFYGYVVSNAQKLLTSHKDEWAALMKCAVG